MIYKLCPHASAVTLQTGEIEYPDDFCDYPILQHGGAIEIGPGSNRDVAGHSKGCELVAGLMCGCCEVTIKDENRNPHYRATSWKDAIKKGIKGQGTAYADDAGPQVPIRDAGYGTGKGSGGTVSFGKSYKDSGLGSSKLKNADGSGKVFKGTLAPEVALAHELGHALRGCRGEMVPVSDIGWRKDKGKEIKDYDPWKGVLGDPGDLRATWGDREEHDTINDWENPIARELGEDQVRVGHG
jgi:hypothetical protein